MEGEAGSQALAPAPAFGTRKGGEGTDLAETLVRVPLKVGMGPEADL